MAHDIGSIRRPDPLAFFLTWTTYGSWLPGDGRGWVDDRGEIRAPNSRLAHSAAGLLRSPPVTLTPVERETVVRAIHAQCRHRGWILHVADCRTAHVHAVVSAADRAPETVLQHLKAWCSRQLSRAAQEPRTWWTKGGSVRRVYDMRGLESVVAYVAECQEKPRVMRQEARSASDGT
jgi:hypothetical protein